MFFQKVVVMLGARSNLLGINFSVKEALVSLLAKSVTFVHSYVYKWTKVLPLYISERFAFVRRLFL